MRLKIVFVCMVLGLLSSSALAVGFLGPSTAELNKGQWSIGYNYLYSDQDLDDSKLKYMNSEGITDQGELSLENVKLQRHYGTVSYGLADWWEIYASVGVADVKTEAEETYPGELYEYSLNFDNDIAWGWGTRITFLKGDSMSWGAAVQMNWLDTSWDEKGSDWKDEVDIDCYDLFITVGPTFDMGGWKLYCGPFYYYLDGDIDYKYSEPGYWSKTEGDVEADANFGGRVGVQIPVAQTWDLTVEGSATGDGWGLGGGLAWKF